MTEAPSPGGNVPGGIVSIGVRGYKSLFEKQEIEIWPLTVVAGVNSSGKSSLLQPLLLMKQTLEAPFDPGPLLLDGPHVSVTSLDQVLSRGTPTTPAASEFEVSLGYRGSAPISIAYGRGESGDLRIMSMTFYVPDGGAVRLFEGSEFKFSWVFRDARISRSLEHAFPSPVVVRERCILVVSSAGKRTPSIDVSQGMYEDLTAIIHIPALRGNPARAYPVSAAIGVFEGPFDRYTASVVAAWQDRGETDKLTELRRDLVALALTSDVQARRLDDTRVELLVSRLPASSTAEPRDMVNISDVGFGVSQTLPVVVALLVAEPGQLVYLEQPEIHLHPRAQVAFAALLARAVGRGVRVVVETHSSLLIRGIQTTVAEGDLAASDVVLHWCSRDAKTGYTNVTTGQLDEAGAFGDWPEDFDDVNLDAEERYLDAAARHDV